MKNYLPMLIVAALLSVQLTYLAPNASAAAGKTTVFFRGVGGGDPNWYNLNGEVRVHGSVRHILALGFGRILGNKGVGRFVVSDDSAPLVKFQHLQAFGGGPATAENRSASRTLIVESCDMRILGTGRGDIFVTDCSSHVDLRQPGQKCWAHQPRSPSTPSYLNAMRPPSSSRNSSTPSPNPGPDHHNSLQIRPRIPSEKHRSAGGRRRPSELQKVKNEFYERVAGKLEPLWTAKVQYIGCQGWRSFLSSSAAVGRDAEFCR
jgi:hypothetical protein